MRDLQPEEIELVAGGEGGGGGGFGDIVVTGSSSSFASDFAASGAFSLSQYVGLSSGFGSAGYFGGGGGYSAPTTPAYPADWVDNDGDGVPDGPLNPDHTITSYDAEIGAFVSTSYRADGTPYSWHWDYVDNTPSVATPPVDGSFYGGGWLAGLTGASVSGGGDQSHASWLVGLGYGFNFGYSSDPNVATQYSNIVSDGWILPGTAINGVPTPFTSPFNNIEFNWDPFTIGVGFGAGGAYAVDSISNPPQQ